LHSIMVHLTPVAASHRPQAAYLGLAAVVTLLVFSTSPAAHGQGAPKFQFNVTDSLGPFLRFGQRSGNTIALSVLVAVQAASAAEATPCLTLTLSSGTVGAAEVGEVVSDGGRGLWPWASRGSPVAG
jgi:hypothetical protein